jgi:hypothetical protein
MSKQDYVKQLRHLYGASARSIDVVMVPEMNFLMVGGAGDPNSAPAFAAAVEALFSLSYTLKFMIKKGQDIDYGVLPLEALWWSDDPQAFSSGTKDAWLWTVMVMQPELVTEELVAAAHKEVQRKKQLVALPLVRFEAFTEGKSAQTLHIGPFSDEGPTTETVHRFIADSGSQRIGKHHEIYLSDIRRAAPEKWRTIIRQPME